MEQQRDTCSLIIVFLLAIVNIGLTASSQNLYAFTTTTDADFNDGDGFTNYTEQPENATSIVRVSTTDSPFSTSARAKESLETAETKAVNKYAKPSYRYEERSEEDSDSEESPSHTIPYSEHEEARDVPTRPKYVAPGYWAKPPPDKDIPLDFVPTKLHAQVRGTHSAKRLPQREAIESADNDEERLNAHRLRKVVTNSKVNTVYTEEGYEDSAYDHAGHVRDADFQEGFARKHHDQRDSRRKSTSGKKRGKYESLPEKFEEYDEDYRDHLEENRELKETSDDSDNNQIDRDTRKGSTVQPKRVVESSIRKLEEDIEKDAEETERNSKSYQEAQESKRDDSSNADSSESEAHEDDLNDDEESIETKEDKSQSEKIDVVDKETKRSQGSRKRFYKKNYETTVLPIDDETSSSEIETSAGPRSLITSAPSSQEYPIEQATLHYVPSATIASLTPIDDPTTISYSQVFWDYFKKLSSSTVEPTLLLNSTTPNSQSQERTPILVTTVDGRNPYFLVTMEKTTTMPSTFLGSTNFHPQNLFSDSTDFDPISNQGRNRHLPGGSLDEIGSANNAVTASTVETFTSAQRLLFPSSLQSSRSEDAAYLSSTSFLDSVESSNIPVTTLNKTQEAYSQVTEHQTNPALDNDNVVTNVRNKIKKYKVMVRKKARKRIKPAVHKQAASLPITEEEYENQKSSDELSTKNYFKSKQKIKSFPEKKKNISSKDLISIRPPIPQRAAYPIFPNSRSPFEDHSSVSAAREWNLRGLEPPPVWKDLLFDQHRSQPANLLFHLDPFAVVHPVHPTYRKTPRPATKLLPPQPIASTYANYHSKKHSNYHLSDVDSKTQQRDNALRYLPLVPDVSWRTISRRKRSSKVEDRDNASDVKAKSNNNMTNDDESAQQDEGLFSRVRRTGKTNGKSSSRCIIDKSIDVSDTRPRDGESVITTMNTNGTDGESGSARVRHENVKVTTIKDSKSAETRSKLFQTVKQEQRTNDTNATKKKRDVMQRETLRSLRYLKNRANRGSHEELLNKSPKISGDVVDKEIKKRFNNETSRNIEDEKEVEVEVPILDYVDELAENSRVQIPTMTEVAVNSKKYPFYNNKNVPSASALKYVVDPRTIPRKTSRGMEFYDSRNAYKQCDEVEPNLDKVLPAKEEPDPERGPQEDLPRLRGLGEKLDCFKAKYFDENPFDNPLFAEKLVEDPTPPLELDPVQYASKVILLPEEDDDEYVVPRLSKKPERGGRQWMSRDPRYDVHESIQVNYMHDRQRGRGKNAYLHSVRGTRPLAVRRVKKRRSRVKTSSTTQSPKLYLTSSYHNQVYEDVMGNIRNMANAYQTYEMTTLPPVTQTLTVAGSENMLEIVNVTSNFTKEKEKAPMDDTDVKSNTKSLEIKGLIPPPKYSTSRLISYRKRRPINKGRIPLLRPPNIPRIIAHHHSLKLNKRSVSIDNARNTSDNISNEDEKNTVNKSVVTEIDENNATFKSIEVTTLKVNSTTETLDLDVEESKRVRTQNPKIEENRRRRNSTNSERKDEPSHRVIYTIRDRIRYSKPKWDTKGYGKFSAKSQTIDEDDRRKEPRYDHFSRNRPVDEQRDNSTKLRYDTTDSVSRVESATLSAEGGESGAYDTRRSEESIARQSIYDRENEYPELAKIKKTAADARFEESVEEETESTTNTYRVHEHVDEGAPASTTELTSPLTSKEILSLEKYFETDPPGYAEAFPEEETISSNKQRTDANEKPKDHDEEQDEETDYLEGMANPWKDSVENDSSEKGEEQIETPMKTELSTRDVSSEGDSSKEEKGSNNEQTFFKYTGRPSWADKKEEHSEKMMFYRRPFSFSKYKSRRKEESDEKDSEENSEEGSQDYIFPWHTDKENDKIKKLQNVERHEYPWEKRERLAKELQKKRIRVDRLRMQTFSGEDGNDEDGKDERESRRRPFYSWERYNVPSKGHLNARRDVSPQNADNSKESNAKQLSPAKFSSRYSSSDVDSPLEISSAQEISRSIEKVLEEGDESRGETSKEFEDPFPSFARKSFSPEGKQLSRGTLVPESVTQPSRKEGRRRSSRIEKNAASNVTEFNSRKTESREIDDEEIEGKEPMMDYFKLNKSSSSDAKSQIETTGGQLYQLPNTTKETSSASSEQRKKRRRRIIIPKNNSTIPIDSVAVESSTVRMKRRRKKPRVSTTTTSAATSASSDLETSKSVSVPVRRRYSKTDDTDETNKSNSSRRIPTSMVKIIGADNAEVETSTPKTRTIEHRSRVSKEKIVTKTTYPNEEQDFDFLKNNATIARKETAKRLKIKLNRKKNNDEQIDDSKNQSDKQKSIKSKNVRNYDTKSVSEDEIKKLETPEKSKVKNQDNPLKNFKMRREEIKKINDFSTFGEVINDDNDSSDSRNVMTSEVSLSPQHRTVQLTQSSSRQILSSMSWISKNYDH